MNVISTLRRHDGGDYVWTRTGISIGPSPWKQGFTSVRRYNDLIWQQNIKLGPVLFYRIRLLNGETLAAIRPRGEN